MDEVELLRSQVLKLEQLVGGLVQVLDTYLPRSRWTSRSGRYDKWSRARLDQVIEIMHAPPPASF